MVKARAVFLILALIVCGCAQAQDISRARANEEFLRQQQRERSLREQQETRPAPALPTPAPEQATEQKLPARLVVDETPCFTFTRLALAGDTAPAFEWALDAAHFAPDGSDDAAFGRCLGALAIQQIAQRVQTKVLAEGYSTTRILSNQQNIAGGVLTLVVMPGRVSKVRLESARATSWNAMPVEAGALLNLHAIEQGLENFRRLPTVQASFRIDVSEENPGPGNSDVIIDWKQERPWRIATFVDDSGSRATGKIQAGLTLACDHCLALNDIFYTSFNHDLGSPGGSEPGARGSQARILHYSLPLGYALLEFNHSRYNYHQLVAGPVLSTLYSGESENSDVRISRLVHRSAVSRTTLASRLWLRTSRNFLEDTEIQLQNRRMAGWELSAIHRRTLGPASLDTSLVYRHGTGAFSAQPAPEEDAQPGVSRPQVVTGDIQFNLPFRIDTHSLRYSANLRGQWNRTPLIPQDQFAIGGRYTVRGFDGERSLLAERGWLLRNDLALTISESGHELYVGLDHGGVSGPSASLLPGRHLTGAVLGWRGSSGGLGFDFFIGRPVRKPQGFQPARITSGFNINWTY